MNRIYFLLTIAGLLASGPVYADISIGCGGYNRALNDHVEWGLKINGKDADLGGKHFSMRETKRFYFLTRPGSVIRIDKVAKRYVEWGGKGRKAPPVEWSRNVPGEGCDISKPQSK